MAKGNSVLDAELLSLRKQIMEKGFTAGKTPEVKSDNRLTAEKYLYRHFMLNYASGDEQVKIKLLWRRDDKIGRARVNLYSPAVNHITRSFFVHIWHTDQSWQHLVLQEPTSKRSIFNF